MGPTVEDDNDSAWDQREIEERRRREEEMLTADPGYFNFLQSFEEL